LYLPTVLLTVATVMLILHCSSVCRLSSRSVCNVGPTYCGYTVLPRTKITIDSLWTVIYEKSIGTTLTFVQRLFKVMSIIASHSPLNILETVRDKLGSNSKGSPIGNGIWRIDSHVTDDVTNMTLKGQIMTPILCLKPIISKTAGDANR